MALAHDHADQPMLSRTHGQPASPTTIARATLIPQPIHRFMAKLHIREEPLANVVVTLGVTTSSRGA